MARNLYTSENVQRARYAQIALAVVTVIVCGYVAIGALLAVQSVWTAEKLLRDGKSDAAKLSRQESMERRQEARRLPASDGGVDSFAVQVSAWAKERGIRIDSFVPEGAPAFAEITSDGSKIGTWASSRVRVQGSGRFGDLMSFLDELRAPQIPVQLQSFALQGSQSGTGEAMTFSIMLTVYEKKSGAS